MRLAGSVTTVVLAAATPGWAQVGWQTVTAGGPGEPLTVQVWYPTADKDRPEQIGPFLQRAARNAPVRGRALPLVVISHGSGGSAAFYHHTAHALAEAGFVVAAPNHAGDTSGDMRLSGRPRQFSVRAHQVVRVIDYMARDWPQRAALDAERVGVVGHSAGATTALILAGGEPDFTRFHTHCTANPQAMDCRFFEAMRLARATRAEPPTNPQAAGAPVPGPAPAPAPTPSALSWTHDSRVKAVVVAAPAIGYLFEGDGLKTVTVPVQLWVGDKDEITPAVWNADVIRRKLPRSPTSEIVPGGGHSIFLASCPPAFAAQAPDVCADPAGFRRADFHQRFNQAVVGFFRSTLPASRERER